MDKFDSYMEEWAQPLPEPPPPPPEVVPMEKTVLVDLASEVENKRTYIGDEDPAWKLKKAEGTMAPPVDVYEPGFRSDLTAAIKDFFRKQAETRANNQRIREKTGIGRYRTWTP